MYPFIFMAESDPPLTESMGGMYGELGIEFTAIAMFLFFF